MTKRPKRSEQAAREVWEITLFQYVQKREWQTFDAIEESEKLLAMYREEANSLYRKADELERHGAPRSGKHPMLEIMNRIQARGYGKDGVTHRMNWAMVDPSDPSPGIPLTAADLRRLAGRIIHTVELEETALTGCKDSLQRRRAMKRPGRRPKSALHVLLTRAKNQGIGDSELARRLVAADVAPEGSVVEGESDDDRFERWRAIFKSARRRPGLE